MKREVLRGGDPVLVVELLQPLLVVLLRRDRVVDRAGAGLAAAARPRRRPRATTSEKRSRNHRGFAAHTPRGAGDQRCYDPAARRRLPEMPGYKVGMRLALCSSCSLACCGDRAPDRDRAAAGQGDRGRARRPAVRGRPSASAAISTRAGDGGAGRARATRRTSGSRSGSTSPQELWAQVGTNHALQERRSAPRRASTSTCRPGDSPVELRASNKDGVSAAWTIRELGTKTKSWYDTFVFNCGMPGVCSFDELDATRRTTRRCSTASTTCAARRRSRRCRGTRARRPIEHPSDVSCG